MAAWFRSYPLNLSLARARIVAKTGNYRLPGVGIQKLKPRFEDRNRMPDRIVLIDGGAEVERGQQPPVVDVIEEHEVQCVTQSILTVRNAMSPL